MEIAVKVATIHGIVGFLIPLTLVGMLTRFFSANRSFIEGFRIWKFALVAGLAFTIPYYIVARVLGPEFPPLLGGIIGLLIVVPAARAGLFMPKDVFDFPPRAQWDEAWVGKLDDLEDHHAERQSGEPGWSIQTGSWCRAKQTIWWSAATWCTSLSIIWRVCGARRGMLPRYGPRFASP
jgi:L-lactate permease